MKSFYFTLLAPVALALFASSAKAAQSHADAFSDEGLTKADVASLPNTQFLAHPDLPLDKDKNVIWCGTLQLAWNSAIDLVGEKLQFVTQPPVVDLLNQEDFTSADLDPNLFGAVADFEKNHVEDKIRAALQKTFGGAASPELIPEPEKNPQPYDFVAYSYLFKNLQFAKPFAKNTEFNFEDHPVKSFGFLERKSSLDPAIFLQVRINDYQSPDDFIITLQTKATDDDLILAKIAPGATMQETITSVMQRIAAQNGHWENPGTRDSLAVPDLNFDLKKSFKELVGLNLKPGPNIKVDNLVTEKVEQLVRFQLNEKGAVLKSEAVIQMVGAMAMANEPPPYEMLFDKPFLILMKQAKSDKPYFAMWVGNSALLIPGLSD